MEDLQTTQILPEAKPAVELEHSFPDPFILILLIAPGWRHRMNLVSPVRHPELHAEKCPIYTPIDPAQQELQHFVGSVVGAADKQVPVLEILLLHGLCTWATSSEEIPEVRSCPIKQIPPLSGRSALSRATKVPLPCLLASKPAKPGYQKSAGQSCD